MDLETKPKCFICGERGEELDYFWWGAKRGKGGNLLHRTCAIKRSKMLAKINKRIEDMQVNKE